MIGDKKTELQKTEDCVDKEYFKIICEGGGFLLDNGIHVYACKYVLNRVFKICTRT